MGPTKNMVTDCLLAKVNFPLYAAEMLTSRWEKLKIYEIQLSICSIQNSDIYWSLAEVDQQRLVLPMASRSTSFFTMGDTLKRKKFNDMKQDQKSS
jgi:hypothetical protein